MINITVPSGPALGPEGIKPPANTMSHRLSGIEKNRTLERVFAKSSGSDFEEHVSRSASRSASRRSEDVEGDDEGSGKENYTDKQIKEDKNVKSASKSGSKSASTSQKASAKSSSTSQKASAKTWENKPSTSASGSASGLKLNIVKNEDEEFQDVPTTYDGEKCGRGKDDSCSPRRKSGRCSGKKGKGLWVVVAIIVLIAIVILVAVYANRSRMSGYGKNAVWAVFGVIFLVVIIALALCLFLGKKH